MNNYVIAHIRQYVPIVVAVAATWLARKWGVVIDDDTSATVTLAVVGILEAGYYAAVRAVARRWPPVEALLGSRRPPSYGGST